MLVRAWSSFVALPRWARAIAWFFAWPLLAAAAVVVKTADRTRPRYVEAGALLFIGGFVWSAVLVGVFSGPAERDLAAAPVSPPTAEAAATVDAATATPDASAGDDAEEIESEDGDDAATSTASDAEPGEEAPAGGDDREDEGGATDADPTGDTTGDTTRDRPAKDAAETAGGLTWTVFNVVDGDTVDVRAGNGTEERIRVIGIDTPERGQCGFGEATAALERMIDGRAVGLVPGARDDRDRYGRLLRYLDVGGVDPGLRLIEQGFAIARYDSRDGYGRHPREDAYVAADAASAAFTCAAKPAPAKPKPAPAAPKPSPTPAPAKPSPKPAPAKPTPSPTAEPAPPPPPPASGPGTGPGGAWKNCTEAREAGAAPVYRGDPGYGSHLDRDNDGIGCE